VKLNRLIGLWGHDTSWTVADRLPEIPGSEISTSQLESLALKQRSGLARNEATSNPTQSTHER
jgi:hypothetical protein